MNDAGIDNCENINTNNDNLYRKKGDLQYQFPGGKSESANDRASSISCATNDKKELGCNQSHVHLSPIKRRMLKQITGKPFLDGSRRKTCGMCTMIQKALSLDQKNMIRILIRLLAQSKRKKFCKINKKLVKKCRLFFFFIHKLVTIIVVTLANAELKKECNII